MEYSSTLCFAGIIEKRENPSRKEEKRGQNNSLCRNTTFISHDTKFKQAKGTMSQPSNLCRSKDWLELKAEKSFLGRDRKVFCRDRT